MRRGLFALYELCRELAARYRRNKDYLFPQLQKRKVLADNLPKYSNDILTGLVNQDNKYTFALESTNLIGKSFVPLDKEKGAKASL